MNRYIVTHETIVLDTDFEKCELTGFVELTVSLQKEYFYIREQYHDSKHNRISVNVPVCGCDNFTIHEITVDGYNAKYQQRPPYLRRINKNFSNISDLHNFETLFLSNVADVMDYGELMITIPSQLLCTTIPSLNINLPPHKKRKLNGYSDNEHAFAKSLLQPLIVKIAFTAKEPIDGLHFVVPRDSNGTPSSSSSPSLSHSNTNTNSNSRTSSNSLSSPVKHVFQKKQKRFGAMEYDETLDEQKKNEIMYPDRKCHMYCYNCHWLPCQNGLKYRCSYTLQISVPLDYIAICNGELKVSKSTQQKTIFIYDIAQPILAKNVSFAVGPFKEILLNDILLPHHLSTPQDDNQVEDDDDDDSSDDNADDHDKDKDHGDDDDDVMEEKEKVNTSKAQVDIKIYILPNTDINDIITTTFNIPRMIRIYSNYLSLPYPYNKILFVFVDEAYDTHLSYLNLNILSTDLIHTKFDIEESYLSNKHISLCIAENWMNDALCNIDAIEDLWIKFGFIGLLYCEWISIFEGQNEIEYRKSMYRLHREENGPHPHQHPTPPLSWNGYLHERQLYVSYYKFITEKAMFVMIMLQQLIGSSSFKRNIINKFIGHKVTTKTLETHLCNIYSEKQIKTFFHNFIYGDACPRICAEYLYRAKDKRHLLCIKQEKIENMYCSPVIGRLKLQIQELEHETIEYIEIPLVNKETVKYEFVCQSRAKRKHKNSAENEPWLEAPANNDTPIKYVRIDPEYEWLFHLVFFIVDHKIAITQLLHDDVRDIKSQIEAIYSLRFVPCKDVSDALLQTLNDEMNYYKVRLQAAKALAQDRNPETLHENKTELINIIKKLWDKTMKKNNKCTRTKKELIINYFLIKNIIKYLSVLSEHKAPHFTPIEIVDLILYILKELIDDKCISFEFNLQYLISSIIIDLGNIRVSYQRYNKLNEIVLILSQILSLQRLFKSHGGIVRSSCLKTFCKLHLNHPQHKKLELSIKKIRQFCKYGKFHDNVRLTAFEIMCSLICDTSSKQIKKCLRIISIEKIPGIKMKMFEIWTRINLKNDYFIAYEEMSDVLHEKNNQQEEKLDAINLRPTLRGYLSKNFNNRHNNNKGNEDGSLREVITQRTFNKMVLRNAKSMNQEWIAYTIWNLLLQTIDKKQSIKYCNEINNELIEYKNNTMIKSIDLMFAVYDLYKSIWKFNQPPFLSSINSVLLPSQIGNQKRVYNAIQSLKNQFNNNNPMFCSFI